MIKKYRGCKSGAPAGGRALQARPRQGLFRAQVMYGLAVLYLVEWNTDMIKKILKNMDLCFTLRSLSPWKSTDPSGAVPLHLKNPPFIGAIPFARMGLCSSSVSGSIYIYRTKANLLGLLRIEPHGADGPRLALNVLYRILATLFSGLITYSFF
jgi:hypothetical protein